MTKEASNGAGTLRPRTETVKTEKSPSRRKASRPGKSALVAPPPELVTVAVTMPLELYRQILAMEYYDSRNRRLDVSAAIVEDMEGAIKCWDESGDKNPTPEEYLREFEQELDAGLYPTVYPPPLAVQLDEEADRLVRWALAGDPAYTPADVVNGSVRYHYGEETAENGGMVRSHDCLKAARDARLGKEGA